MITTIDVQVRKDGDYVLFYRDSGHVGVYKVINQDRVSDLVFHLKRDDRFETNVSYRDSLTLIWFDKK